MDRVFTSFEEHWSRETAHQLMKDREYASRQAREIRQGACYKSAFWDRLFYRRYRQARLKRESTLEFFCLTKPAFLASLS